MVFRSKRGKDLAGQNNAAEKSAEPTAGLETDEASEATEADATQKLGWRGPKLVALIAGVAVASLLVGVAAMQFIVSPAELAARTKAPKPGPITAAIESIEIENTVITRGEITYADEVEAAIDASASAERPVITGHVPEVGTILKQGNIALEVAGRPVIVMPGVLPAYRSLAIGMRGPDVIQLKKALTSMGFAPGDAANDTYDGDTAAAVGALYQQVGFDPAAGGEEARDALKGAERAVRDANVAVAQAEQALAEAKKAKVPSTIAEEAALESAWEALGDAQEALVSAQQAVQPTLPSSEVLFLDQLPRRVDSVSVKRGDILSGSPMTVSGATLTVTGTVSAQDAALLKKDQKAYYPGPDGKDLEAKVIAITPPAKGGGSTGSDGDEGEQGKAGGDTAASGGRFTVVFSPGELTSAQIEALRGTNVRLRIPVASTDGEVLAVPIAALSAGSGGEDRVEILTGETKGDEPVTEVVKVTAGLAADGYVEITSTDDRIKQGAKVVVGR